MDSKWRLVARHEYQLHVRRKGFIATTVGFPLLFIGGFAILFAVLIWGQKPQRLGYVDQSALASGQPDQLVITDTLAPDITLLRFADEPAARAAAASHAIDGFLVIPADYMATGALTAYAEEDLTDSSKDAIDTFMRRLLIANTGSPAPARLEEPLDSVLGHNLVDDRAMTSEQGFILFFAPYLFSMFFFVAVFTSSSYLMTALVEEKENRVIEILATSLRTVDLMAGKIVGLGLLGLTQIMIWSASILILFKIAQSQIPDLAALSLPGDVLVTAALMFLPAYLLVAACLSTIGAAVSALQEGQQLSGVVSLLMIFPIWFVPVILESPGGAFATLTSLAPFTGPIVMMQRVAIMPVPFWQQLLSFVVQLASAIGMIWVAGRVLRFGMLRYGKRLTWRELARAVRG